MFLSAYTLSYGNWTVIPSHWDRLFGEMRDNGFDAVDLSFSESEAMYSMRAVEQQIAMAHKHGLKVLLIPSRFAGRLAGAPFMSSPFICAHPEWALPGHPGCGCVDVPEVVEHSCRFIELLMKSFELDGLILDEPKEAETPSSHPATVARYGHPGTEEEARTSMLDYLSALIRTAKSFRKELPITIFNMPLTSPSFTTRAAALPGIDYAGFDGTLCMQSYFHEKPFRVKPTVRQLWPRIRQECAGRCGTFALLENMLIPKSEHRVYEAELEATLAEVHPDHFACYYYGHNNEDGEYIQEITMNAIRRLKSR
ncbi:MAG: hypothetical protein IKO93_02260 [Lentisphaeria bacterium]|nr:hypothetical protein [Lentisphaeria bacterium]